MMVMTIILTRLMANSFGFRNKQFARAVCHTYARTSQFTKSVEGFHFVLLKSFLCAFAGDVFSLKHMHRLRLYFPQRRKGAKKSLEEPQCIRNPQPAPHFRGKSLNKREVITIQRIPHVEKVKRDDMRRVPMGEQV